MDKKLKEIIQLKTINIYCDGACSGNPGPGGWAAIIYCYGIEYKIFGNEINTTNNRMELTAAIKAIESISYPSSHINLYTDSKYLMDGILCWLKKWKKNNWTTYNKKSTKNQDLWKRLDFLSSNHHIQWFWIPSHKGNYLNEKVDKLARGSIKLNKINF